VGPPSARSSRRRHRRWLSTRLADRSTRHAPSISPSRRSALGQRIRNRRDAGTGPPTRGGLRRREVGLALERSSRGGGAPSSARRSRSLHPQCHVVTGHRRRSGRSAQCGRRLGDG
jgi:hypothetical protein